MEWIAAVGALWFAVLEPKFAKALLLTGVAAILVFALLVIIAFT